MSHNVGRVVTIAPVRIGPDSGNPPNAGANWEFAFSPQPALQPPGGVPLFVILHLTNLALPGTSRVEIELGYAMDVITSAFGSEAWSRPVDPALGPVIVRFVGAAGGATLAEYGSGEPTATTHPASPYLNGVTNADLFLHGDPFTEPTYQQWLQCGGTFDWENAACVAADPVKKPTSDAVGMIVGYHVDDESGETKLSSCTVTLIDSDLVLTARHCVADPGDLEIRSGSVTFDFATDCPTPGPKPAGYAPTFHKVRGRVANGNWPATLDGDWAILKIDPPPAGIVPRQLRPAGAVAGESTFTVHHPNGSVKKTQSGTLPSGSVADVDNFDYSGGSSGSALFDANGRIIGAALSAAAGAFNVCQVAYSAAGAVITALANPAGPAVPVDVMLVMDRSGSMAGPGTSGPGRTKMIEARDAASLFVQLVATGAGHRMGMVSFSTTASTPPDEPPGNFTNGKQNQLVGPTPPYDGGSIGALAPGGMTSIGDGIQKAMAALQGLPASSNQRALLLMTDGLENTAPLVAAVEGMLGTTEVHAVGFGTEAQLDGALLNRLAADHGGIYTRANDGLELEKFFGLCFGNIFESGSLVDPIIVLKEGQPESGALPFDVCEEERVTVIVGWNDPTVAVEAVITTPGGATVVAGAGVTIDSARTWWFAKVDLPYQGERAGAWQVRVRRKVVTGGEFEVERMPDLRTFVSIVPSGGPRIRPIPPSRRLYTGDRFTPKVALLYPNGTAPYAEVEATIEGPGVALGALVAEHGLTRPDVTGEPVDAFRSTLQAIAAESGGRLPVPLTSTTVKLHDDGVHDDGAMERDGIYGNPLDDVLRFEGTYVLRAVGRYGDGCRGQRETTWSLHVDPGVDPDRTEVALVDDRPSGTGGRVGSIRVTPRDRYGSPLGPGRRGLFEVSAQPASTVDGPVADNGDGSYTIPVRWDAGGSPGLVVSQPGRPPVVLGPPAGTAMPAPWWCRWWIPWLLALLILLVLVLLVVLVTR